MAITPLKFKLPTAQDIQPKFSIKDTTEKLSFTQKVKSLFEPTGYLGSETWKQMLGIGERPSALLETVKKPFQPTAMLGKETLKQFAGIGERPSTLKETVFDVGKGAAYITGLQIPVLREKLIQTQPENVIKYANAYETMAGPFIRKMYPSAIPLAVAEKLVGRKLAATYEEMAQKNPVATMVSGLFGDIYNLALLHTITGGISSSIKIPQLITVNFPFLTNFIPKAAEHAVQWGAKGFLDEGLKQFEAGQFEPKKLSTETGKNALFGILLSGAGAVPKTIPRILTYGGVGAGWSTVEGYLKDKKLDRNDFLNIASTTILSMVFAMIDAEATTRRLESTGINAYLEREAIIKVMSNHPGMSEKDAQAIVELIGKLGGMQKVSPAIFQEVPDQFRYIKNLPLDQQIEIADQITQSIKDQIGAGTPNFDAVANAIQGVKIPEVYLGGRVSLPTPEPKEIKGALEFIQRDGAKQVAKFSPQAAEIWRKTDLTKAKSIDEAKTILKRAIPESEKQKEGVMMTIENFPESAKRMMGTEREAIPKAVYTWEGARPGEKMFKAVQQMTGTMGEGKYYALDPTSGRIFGEKLVEETLPKDLKIYDMTLGKKSVPDVVTFDATNPFYQEALTKNITPIELAKQKGFDALIFFDDTGKNKWMVVSEAPAKAEVPAEPIKVPEERLLPPPPKMPVKEVKPEVTKAIYAELNVGQRSKTMADWLISQTDSGGVKPGTGKFHEEIDFPASKNQQLEKYFNQRVYSVEVPMNIRGKITSYLEDIPNNKITPLTPGNHQGDIIGYDLAGNRLTFKAGIKATTEQFISILKELEKETGIDLAKYASKWEDDIYSEVPNLLKAVTKPTVTPKEVKITPAEEKVGREIYQKEFERVQEAGEGKITSDITSLGGIKTDPTLKEEMSDLPIDIMRKNGVMPDEMLDMLNDRGYRLEDVSDMFESIRAIRSMPSRYRPAESILEQKLTTMRAIRTKMPKIKEVTTTQLERLERQILREATVGRRIPPKQVIAKVTGLKPEPEKMITKKESQLLKMKLRAERRGATEGMRQAKADIISQLRISRTDTTDIRKQITDYVKTSLDPKDRGKANVLIRDAKNQEDLVKAFSRIDRWAENAEKKAIRNDVVSSVKKAIESPAVAIDYKAKIKEVIDEFELKGHLGRTLEKLNATKKYIDERLSLGEDIEIPQRIWNSLKILTRKPYEEMTISEMKGLQDEVKILDAVGRMKWATYEDIYKLEQDAIKDALVEGSVPMARREKIVPKIGEKLSINQTFKNYAIGSINQAQKIDKVVLPMDAIFDWLDGAKGTFSGANSRLIKNKIDRGWNLYQAIKDDIQDPVVEKAIHLKMKDGNMERIGFVAAREQEGGMEKLKQLGYTEEEINAVKLTKDEQTMLDMMRGAMEKEYPYVVDIMRKVYNQPVGKVKNYFSFMTDWTKTDEVEIYKRMGPAAEEFGLPTKTVEHGFTIPRRAMAKQKIKLNAMSIFLRHTDNTSYLRSLGRDIKMLFEIVNSDEYKESAGELGQLLVVEWLDLMARKGGSAGAKKIAILDWMRKNIGTGMIGFKISSAAVQWTEVIPAMGLIGPEYGMKGIFNIATSKDWREFIMKFPEIRNRAGGETAILELINGSAFRKLQAKAFIPLQWVDTWAATSVAAGAYEKKMAELGKEIDLLKDPNQEAMEYAQQIVRRNQGVAGYKDIPLAISRGALTGSTSFDRAMLQFQNFVLFRWSRIRYEALKVGIEIKDYKKMAGVLFWTLVGALAAVGTKMGVDALSDFVTGKERKDTEAIKKVIYEIVGSVPFLGNLYGSYLYDNELIPIFSAPSEALQDLKKAITSKNPNTRARGLAGFITTLMTLMGIPGMLQAEQLLKKAIPTEAPKQLLPPTKRSPTPPAPRKPSSLLKPKSSVENLLVNIFKRELT